MYEHVLICKWVSMLDLYQPRLYLAVTSILRILSVDWSNEGRSHNTQRGLHVEIDSVEKWTNWVMDLYSTTKIPKQSIWFRIVTKPFSEWVLCIILQWTLEPLFAYKSNEQSNRRVEQSDRRKSLFYNAKNNLFLTDLSSSWIHVWFKKLLNLIVSHFN